jgi:hypothetical protein
MLRGLPLSWLVRVSLLLLVALYVTAELEDGSQVTSMMHPFIKALLSFPKERKRNVVPSLKTAVIFVLV